MILALVGPTFSGKTTLLNELEKNNAFKKVITHTTRPMRNGEIDGKDYFFEKTFVKGRNTVVPRTYTALNDENEQEDWTYWINSHDLKGEGIKVVILDPQGVEELKKVYKKDQIQVALLNPSLDIIQHRIKNSNRSKENKKEIERRLQSDLYEIFGWEMELRTNGSNDTVILLTGENSKDNADKLVKEVHI